MARAAISARNFDSSSSQSSVESQDFAYNFPIHQQPSRGQQQQLSGSPPGPRHLSLDFPPTQNDQFVQTPQQALYNNSAMDPAEFTPFPPDNETQQQGGPFENSTFRNNSIFGSYLSSRNRQSLAGTSSTGFGNDAGALNNMNQFNALPANEVYGPQLPLQALSQQQQQQQQQQTNAGVRGYDFANDSQAIKTNGKSLFTSMDTFNGGAGLSAQQFNNVNNSTNNGNNNNKLAQMQQQQQQQQMQNFASQAFANGIMQQQQAAYGPQMNANSAGLANLSLANNLGNISITTQQEEISTIFVVGFPDDMQEREFQNMFTFSSGFEAATLKIPNKDSTAYSSNVPPTNQPGNRGAFQLGGFNFNGPNDPYNMLTVNQGGIVVDGRDGTTSWPSADANDFQRGLNSNNAMNAQNQAGPPRKQIIGFAKFRTRAEALAARDLLQGRRVDIEKGSVLKAEMAKKNLHMKRGVGPLGAPLSVNVGNNGVSGSGNMNSVMNGPTSSIPDGLSGMSGMLSPGATAGAETLSARERELGPLGAMGLGGLTRRGTIDAQTQQHEDDRDNRRRREFGSVSAITNGLGGLNMLGPRGARERVEEDEREKRRKEKEAERNSRIRNQATFDAFHSVSIPPRSASLAQAALSAGVLSPSESGNAYPFPNTAQLFSPQEPIGPQGSDVWPQAVRRAGSMGLNGIGRSLPVGVSTSNMPTNVNARQSPSQESSPTEASADPASLSSRSALSEKPTQDGEASMGSLPPPSSSSLTSHASLSSLGSRSRPYSPPSEMSSSGFFPSMAEQLQGDQMGVGSAVLAQQQQQQLQQQQQQQRQRQQTDVSSSSSSVSETRSTSSSAHDEDVSRTIGNIDILSQEGTISPQLPSPNSGASSGTGRTNASDHNPPINTLYVGNLPTSPVPSNQPNFLEESLRTLFARCAGYRKLCFRQKSNGPMCFVEFEDVNFATKALNELYGNNLNGLVKGGIRLSYSKNPLGVRTPTNATNNTTGLQQGLQQAFGSGSFPSLQDAFSRQTNGSSILSIDMSTIRGPRRDVGDVTSPTGYYASSPPPPRFFSPPPSSAFGTGVGVGVSAAAGGHSSMAGLSRQGSQGFTSSFSPFGTSTPPEMMSMQTSGNAGANNNNSESGAAASGSGSASMDAYESSSSLSTTPSLDAKRAS